jgi:hypothetical protein
MVRKCGEILSVSVATTFVPRAQEPAKKKA